MAILHTVNKSPYEKTSLASCVDRSVAGSAILLIEDGVYAALAAGAAAELVKKAMADRKVYVLEPDLKARGLADQALIEGVESVDFDGFVDLTTQYDQVNAWL